MDTPTLIHNVTIVTGDEAGSLHHDAALGVQGRRIAAIGPTAELLARYPEAERVDGRARAVLPGFANTHTHFTMTLARGIYEDLSPPHSPPFSGGLAPLPLPSLSPDQRRVMVQLAALEAIRSGTTLVLEDGVGLDSYAGALLDSGLRYLLCERAWDRTNASIGQPGPFEVDPALGDAGITRITRLHARWHDKDDGRLRVGLAAWAPTCAPPTSSDGYASSSRSSAPSRPFTSTRSGARSRPSRGSAVSCRPSTSRARASSLTGWWPPTVVA
jgi:5-methylthioadenosine/S-adenosylhomocysteine deaminase